MWAKRFVVGCVGGFFALSAAQAADLPVKAAPVQYVKICSLYGVGFYYIPGTDMCIKVGGYMRAQYEWNSSDNGRIYGSTNSLPQGGANPGILGGLNNRFSNDLQFGGRGAISFDARSPTAFGTVRSYIRFLAQDPAGSFTGAGPGAFTDRWFIQWAGLTVGLTQSNFDIFTTTEGFSYFDAKTSGDTYNYGVEMFAYTFNFGQGVSATLAAETPVRHYQAGVINGFSGGFGFGGTVFTQTAGLTTPDLVGNLRIDQSWGYAGISGALHRVAGTYYGTTENTGHPADQYGWAASIGGLVILPWRDTIGANFAWTKGAVGYVTKAGNWQMYNGTTLGLGWVADGIYDTVTPNGGAAQLPIELTNAWAVNAAYEHVWNPQWRTSLYGGYTKVWYDQAAINIINQHLPTPFTAPGVACGVAVEGSIWPPININHGENNSCSPNFSFWQVGSRTQWNVTSALAIGVDVAYTRLNTAYEGSPVVVGANGGHPAETISLTDQDIWSAILRVQYSFVP
jgi:Porin subfamily